MERTGHLREQGWESWEDSMKIVNYINHPPWQSHKCRDVLKKTHQCNTAENYIIIYSFTALVLVLIECNQKGETPGISMQVGIQKGGNKESTGVMAKQISKFIFKVKCYISTKAEVSHGKWRRGNAVTPNQGTALAAWVSKLLAAHTRAVMRHCVAEDKCAEWIQCRKKCCIPNT